eukprot:5761067-Amphidinium_carterae.1
MAYFFLTLAYLRVATPDRQLKALQKSVAWFPQHALRPEWLANLGNAYGSLGDARKQRDFLERALQILECRYGPEHPEVATMLSNLGSTYGSLGDARKQRDFLERALRIGESHYGPEHPE